ncbi:MAG: TIGR03086 family metal-binding protein [Actinomycetota bacterium]
MDAAAVLRTQAALTSKVVGGVRAEQLGLPTPCQAWDVRSLINHLCMTTRFCARVAAGEQAEPEYETDFLGGDPAGAYARERDAMLQACSDPGLAERSVSLPVLGDLPGNVVPVLALSETVVHRWDLATALGVDTAIDPEVATFLLDQGRAMVGDTMRAPSADQTTGSVPFGPPIEVGDDASSADELLTFLGRTP